jgi:hypothetical protein
MGYIDANGKYRNGRHARTQLVEVSLVRTNGFQDAVDDLGTHLMHGVQVPYSRVSVYGVLQGRIKSEKLLRRIAERRPDLFNLRYVCDEVREWAAKHKEVV